MILFYSNHCSSCQMLLDQINNYNKKTLFKFVNVERILSKGLKLPKEVNVVPTLFINNNTYLHSKQLFDYLLLPNRGILFNKEYENKHSNDNNNDALGISSNNNDPMAFTLGTSSTSEIFAFIDDENNTQLDDHKIINWSSINENATIITPTDDKNQGTVSKKSKLPDISTLRQEREMELQNHLNNTALPPVSNN